jgi:hypothetical protein
MWGRSDRVYSSHGCNTVAASVWEKFEPKSRTEGGRDEFHGVAAQSRSDAERVFPGMNPGETNARLRSA